MSLFLSKHIFEDNIWNIGVQLLIKVHIMNNCIQSEASTLTCLLCINYILDLNNHAVLYDLDGRSHKSVHIKWFARLDLVTEVNTLPHFKLIFAIHRDTLLEHNTKDRGSNWLFSFNTRPKRVLRLFMVKWETGYHALSGNVSHSL